ncbi:MAG TPA: primosomal protein N', partial [Caulobacteraceae bacterium]
MRIAAVLLPLPVPEAFDYAVPDGMALAAGDHVVVPLGPRLVRGLVSEVREQTGSNRQLKSVAERLDDPSVPAASLAFAEWAARWTLTPPGEMAAMALRGLRAPMARPERRVELVEGVAPGRPTPARERVIEAAQSHGALPAAELARRAEVSAGVVKGLVDEGVLTVVETAPDGGFPPPDPDHAPAVLNDTQAAAARALAAAVDARAFKPVLLDGITGSGKTEVYLEAAAHALRADPTAQILILLPEIALTQAVLARFSARFGVEVGEWHSAVSPPRRRRVWEAVRGGRCSIVVGARSALFLPFENLRLIVVDEEHDGSFKQEEGLVYHARDLAVARASLTPCAVVLASATPSIETLWNARAGRYQWVRLGDRHGGARLPDMALIDLGQDAPEHGKWLSPPLVEAVAETLARGEQALLFLNRRGYAPVVLCRACGYRMTAPDSDSWLVEHRYTGRLVCHLTGFSMAKPKRCPNCQAEDSLVSVGPGVERVEEEARERFPDARIAVFSSDTIPDGASARALVERMAAGEIDIMVATQAAAKGHNFPNLTLVGIVDADLGLRG